MLDETVLVRVLVRLVQVHDELGEHCFEEAAQGALAAIGRAAHQEAERIAGIDSSSYGPNVIPFPNRYAGSMADMDPDWE